MLTVLSKYLLLLLFCNFQDVKTWVINGLNQYKVSDGDATHHKNSNRKKTTAATTVMMIL